MPSELDSVIPKLERGEQLSQPAIDEIKRLLQVLQNEGWSGFIPADEAALALGGEAEEIIALLRELRTYTAELEAASAAWFITRSHAKRPEAGDLGERLDVVLGKTV